MEERDTMIKWKKLAATVVAAAAAVSCVGCGNQALAYPLKTGWSPPWRGDWTEG